jgi:SAM-dependent methyltransferase
VLQRAEHWEQVYAAKPPTELSWYQREPNASLRLIETAAPSPAAAVIDVGAGASTLVDRLLTDGFNDLTVLDISQRALDEVAARLHGNVGQVRLVRHDVLTWEPDRGYDVWHDRAVFHFLTEPAARDRYIDVVGRAVRSGGALVLGTFAEDGPEHCSGLPVSRYSPPRLEELFSGRFTPAQREREDHVTPTGVVQPFCWIVLRRAELRDSPPDPGRPLGDRWPRSPGASETDP